MTKHLDGLKPSASRLARYLLDHAEQAIPRSEIAKVAGTGGLTSRCSELRKVGFQIEVKRVWSKRLQSTLTWYVYHRPKAKAAA